MPGAKTSHQDAVRRAAQKPPKSLPPHTTVGVPGTDRAMATTESVVPPVMPEIDTR